MGGLKLTLLASALTGLTLIFIGISTAFIAEIHIPRNSRVNMFDVVNMKGVECSVSGSGIFRDKDIDAPRQPGCPSQVWLRFDSSSYEIKLNSTTYSASLKSWMTERPISFKFNPTNDVDAVIDTKKQDFDLLLYEDYETAIRAAVYNKRDDVNRPRFFYTGTTPPYQLNGLSRKALLESIDNPNLPTTFNEAQQLIIRFVFEDSCEKAVPVRYYNTCQEALDTEYCPCNCEYYDKMKYWEDNAPPADLTEEEKKELVRPAIEATKKQLTVNKSELSSYKNTKISAGDDRTSAQSLGMLGAVILATVLGSLVMCDILSFKNHAKVFKKKCPCVRK